VIDNKLLFVEGDDDLHVISAICKSYTLPQTFKIKIPENRDIVSTDVKIEEKGGIDNVLKAAEFHLIDGADSVECVGIVIDADLMLSARWQSVSSILKKAGFKNLPVLPDPNGTIIKQELLPTFGVWIMPDNKIERGFLETFLTFLVPNPENNKTWQQARKCVAELEERPFIKQEADHTTKAEIHTFLAWQEEPGKPFGLAITKKYLQPENPKCEEFVEWLKRLFVD
jgi:hypothetical protein